MNIPLLRHLPSLGQPPLHRIVASADAPAAKVALQHLLAELPELLMAVVLVVSSGQVLASYTSQPQLKPSSVAPFWAALVQLLQASQLAQGQADEQPAEVLTTLLSQLHLLRLQPDGRQLLYLVVDVHDTNLALARELVCQAINLLTTS